MQSSTFSGHLGLGSPIAAKFPANIQSGDWFNLELIAKGHFVKASGAFGEESISEVPLVETVPGAPDASTERISVKVGAAIKKGHKTIYYGTVPKKCPTGGFPFKAEVLFAGLGGLTPQTVPVEYKVPCPKR